MAMTPKEQHEIEELAGQITNVMFAKLNKECPESFPALTQKQIVEIVLKAVRKELEGIKSKRELALEHIAESLSSSIRRWWD